MDFSSASGNVKEWFYNKNWEFHEDINDMNLRFENGSLVIEPTKDQIGVINREFEKKDYLNGEIKLRIEWGVDQYPKGADWSGQKEKTRNTRQAISFMILFGDDKLDSGFFLAPDLPYYINFFLGENEKPDQVYYGNYWQEGGRYLCIHCDGSKGNTFVDKLYTKAYLRHLFSINENLGKQIATIHNLGFYKWIIDSTKNAIKSGEFLSWKKTMKNKLDNRL